MTEPPDDHLDELLRRANPVDEARLPLPAEHSGAQLLYEQITGTPYGGAKPRRRGFGSVLAAIAALALLGGGVAVASRVSSHPSHRLDVLCYGQARLDTPATSVDAGPDGPVAACAGAWAAGQVGHGPVPLLVACVTTTGVVAVFPSAPGAEVCRQLGLGALHVSGTPTTLPPGTSPPTTDVVVEMHDAVIQSLSSACLTSTQAQATVESILTKAKLSWTVTVPSPFPPGRPCASPAFDEGRDQVILVGIPPAGLPSSPAP